MSYSAKVNFFSMLLALFIGGIIFFPLLTLAADSPLPLLSAPSGMAVDNNDNVYVADTNNNRIIKFNSQGDVVWAWGANDNGQGKLNAPWAVAVDSSGNVYVADTGSNCIQKFNSEGSFLAAWGSFGYNEGQFRYPRGIGVDSEGYIYVADCNNCRIQKLDSSGKVVKTWGQNELSYPIAIFVDKDDQIYVADNGSKIIQKYDSQGVPLKRFGGPGSTPGFFASIYDIALDGSGNIYVVDALNNNVQKLDTEGKSNAQWTSNNEIGPLKGPKGVIVNSKGEVFVADTNNNRIIKLDSNLNAQEVWEDRSLDDGGLNSNPQNPVFTPRVAVYNNDLYVAWTEKINENNQIQVKKYNGLFWSSAQSDHINMDINRNAYNPILTEFNGNLFLAWYEETGVNNTFQVYVKKYDSNTNHWIEGQNISYTSNKAFNVRLTVWDNKLIAIWVENNGVKNQVRVKEYNGITWQAADGGSLNYDVKSNATLPDIAVYNGGLYAAWQERAQIRVKRFNGIDWEEIDFGGLNYDKLKIADMPIMVPGTDNLYIIWGEQNENRLFQVRAKRFDGILWHAADTGSLNNSRTTGAFMLSAAFNNGKFYAGWTEADRIKVKSMEDGSNSWTGLFDMTNASKGISFAEYQGKLYITWQESNGAEQRIRVKMLEN